MRNEIANDGNGEHFSKVKAPEARDGAQWVGCLSSSQKALSSIPSEADTGVVPGLDG